MTTHTDFDPFNGLGLFPDEAPWEIQARIEREEREKAAEEARKLREGQGRSKGPKRPERAAEGRTEPFVSDLGWKDMTARPMDWQRHIAALGISKPAKILGMVMSHFCGPNSHGCSASIDTLAEKAALSRRAADRAVKELRDCDLIRSVGTGHNWVKVYRLGVPN